MLKVWNIYVYSEYVCVYNKQHDVLKPFSVKCHGVILLRLFPLTCEVI